MLFASLLEMNLPPLLSGGPDAGKTADEIIDALKLQPHRGRKWLHALVLAGLLEAAKAIDGKLQRPTDGRLRLSPALRGMFGEDGQGGWFYREFLRFFRGALSHPLPLVLSGAPVTQVRYPPLDQGDILLLHQWMRDSALETLGIIRQYVDFASVNRLLDVAGGDGTMAMALWKDFPQLHVKVFNLPGPVTMVQEQAAKLGATDRVSTQAGDFRTDALPGGNDMVMFSRVLADWPPELCQELLKKAHAALEPKGRLVICEPFADQNPDLALAWEHSYLPYDDFGLYVYKPLALYYEMLSAAKFNILSVHPRNYNTIHCVVIAERIG